jgi:TonB family protein
MITYLLEVHLCWFLFLAFYALAIRQGTYFAVHRWYLLSSLILGLILPLMQYVRTAAIETAEVVGHLLPGEIASTGIAANAASGSIWYWTGVIYWLGAGLAMVVFVSGLWHIGTLFFMGQRKRVADLLTIEHDMVRRPFSFFRWLFVHPDWQQSDETRKYIIWHERVHIRHWHSVDVLLAEFTGIFFWFSPLVWIYKKELRDVHEFEADAGVLRHSDPLEYGKMLLQYTEPGSLGDKLGSSIFGSRLRRRFIKMTEKSSGEPSLLRYLMVLPMFLLLIMGMAFTSRWAVYGQKLVPMEKSALYQGMDTLPGAVKAYENKALPASDKQNRSAVTIEENGVDQMPVFGEGQSDLIQYLAHQVKYPLAAAEDGVQGTVVVQFVVGEDGKVQDVTTIRSIREDLDQSAMDVIRQMPAWKPAIKNGAPVAAIMTMPIKYKLD